MSQDLTSISETRVNRSLEEIPEEPSKKQSKNGSMKYVRKSHSSIAVDRSESARTSTRAAENADLHVFIQQAWHWLVWLLEIYGLVFVLGELACFLDEDPRDPGLQL
ncbi:hypothetical protein BsWGS_26361 [Bradybaena similaris]